MESFIFKLAVAVIPLFLLIASVIIYTELSPKLAHHPLSWHRKRRSIQRALAAGTAIR